MSNWTHVNSVFRIDRRMINHDFNFEGVFGRVCGDYEKRKYDPQYCNEYIDGILPFGSEGACKMSIWVNPQINCAPWYTVSIFGDLRNHESTEAIIEWFVRTCNKIELLRQAVITVENEFNEQVQTATAFEDKISIITYDVNGNIIKEDLRDIKKSD